MSGLPPDPQRLAAIRDFVGWRRSVERILHNLSNRVTAVGTARVGTATVWLGDPASPPAGMLLANGTTVAITAHQVLYDRIGTTYNTGSEPAGTFRLPTYPAPALGVAVVYG